MAGNRPTINYHPQAREQLDRMDGVLRIFFKRHIEKVALLPPRRHLKFGLPWLVEAVTHQARLVYRFRDNECQILRCFAMHKEYERWYKSYR